MLRVINFKKLIPGFFISIVVTALSYLAKPYLVIGAPMIALILGMLLSNFLFKNQDKLKPGRDFLQKRALEVSIVFLGFSVEVSTFTSSISLIVLVPIFMTLTIFATILLGKSFGLSKKESLLIGMGNSVCGNAAVASTGKLIDATPNEIGNSISAINFIGVLLLFIMPVTLSTLDLSAVSKSYLIGSLLQSVGHVGAVAGTFSDFVATTALSFKMWRVLMLVPFSFVIALIVKKRKNTKNPLPPLYMWGFLVAIILNSNLNLEVFKYFTQAGKILLTLAMAAIGLSLNLRELLKNSGKLLLVSGASSLFLAFLLILSVIYYT